MEAVTEMPAVWAVVQVPQVLLLDLVSIKIQRSNTIITVSLEVLRTGCPHELNAKEKTDLVGIYMYAVHLFLSLRQAP